MPYRVPVLCLWVEYRTDDKLAQPGFHDVRLLKTMV
jgi:hypothetical protein